MLKDAPHLQQRLLMQPECHGIATATLAAAKENAHLLMAAIANDMYCSLLSGDSSA